MSSGSWVGAHQAGLNLSTTAQGMRLITQEIQAPSRQYQDDNEYPRVWLLIALQFPVCWLRGGQWSRVCCSWGSAFLPHPPHVTRALEKIPVLL